MGRKLRFDVRKNYERKKAKQQTLSLLVRLPLEVYTKRILTNLSELHRRLHQFSLPPEWEYMTTYRDEKLEVMTIRKAALAIKVQENLQWQILVQDIILSQQCCKLFNDYSARLDNIDVVVKVVTSLEKSTFCIGNGDEKFNTVRLQCNGIFKSKSGTFVISYLHINFCVYMYM